MCVALMLAVDLCAGVAVSRLVAREILFENEFWSLGIEIMSLIMTLE